MIICDYNEAEIIVHLLSVLCKKCNVALKCSSANMC